MEDGRAAANEQYWEPVARAVQGANNKHQADLARAAEKLKAQVKEAADQFVRLGADERIKQELVALMEAVRDNTAIDYGRMALDTSAGAAAVMSLIGEQSYSLDALHQHKRAVLARKGAPDAQPVEADGVVFDIPVAAAKAEPVHQAIARAMETHIERVADDELQMSSSASSSSALRDPYTRQLIKDPVKFPCGHTHCRTSLASQRNPNAIKCGVCKRGPYTQAQWEVDHEAALALETAAAQAAGGAGGVGSAAGVGTDVW